MKSIINNLAMISQGLYSKIFSWNLDIPENPGIIKSWAQKIPGNPVIWFKKAVNSITGGPALTNQGLQRQIYFWNLDIPGTPGMIKFWDTGTAGLLFSCHG